MAVDTQAFRFLLAARKAGVDFGSTVTFGRQSFFPKSGPAARALAHSGVGLTLDQIGPLRHAYAEAFLTALGAKTVDAIDASDYEQAGIVHDLNEPVPAALHGKYSCVFDGGTSEHVYHYPELIANAVRLLAVGGHFVSITSGNNQSGHGFYQISPELFFRVFCRENGFATRAVLLADTRAGGRFYRVADPAALGHRVEFVTAQRLHVAVIAQKLEAVSGLLTRPQQSDYRTQWQQAPGAAARRGGRLAREFRRLGQQLRGFAGRRLYLPWQNPGLTVLRDRELYSL
ncbi:MAG: hypothetical protein ACHQ4G_01315 [Opitutales bacterium]